MKYILSIAFLVCLNSLMAQRNMTFTINTQVNRKAISPYIFGANQYKFGNLKSLNITQNRFGGNRSTAYNWETNYSNAGNDYINNNDNWLLGEVELDVATYGPVAGAVVGSMTDSILSINGTPMVTLQAAGYVAADATGSVTCTAPCNRWIPVYANKPGKNYVYPPDKSDNAVYMDEQVNWLISKYGTADKGGVKFYQIDNESDYWFTTHSMIRPTMITPTQLGAITEEYAKMIKSLDPTSEVFGYVGTGAWGIENWVKGTEFLADMKTRSTNAGMRLMDVFDIHYYQGEMYNVTSNKAWNYLQGSRILWDSTFYFAGAWGLPGNYKEAAKLLRRYKTYIKDNYPDTKLALTEWNTQIPESSIYDGLASVDILGVFINEDVYAANHFNNAGGYTETAIKLFRNYDENKSTFGDIRVEAKTSDYINATIYSSVESATNDKVLHTIIVSKDTLQTINGTFTINSTKNYVTGKVFYFDNNSQQIKQGVDIKTISNNTFSYSIPKLSTAHLVLYTNDACLTPTLGATRNLCDSSEITLNASLPNANYSFVWKKDNIVLPAETSNQLKIHQRGMYSVIASASGCADKSSSVAITSDLLDAPDVTICKGETASLKVNGTQSYVWATDVACTNVVSTVNPYTTNVSSSTAFYVKQTDDFNYVLGPKATSGLVTWSIGFDDLDGEDKAYTFSVKQPITFKSVDINPANDNTSVVIRVYNALGFNKSVTIPSINKGQKQVNVNIDLPVGDYTVDLVGTDKSMIMETTDGLYPYTQTGVIVVNAIKSWAEERTGFFYNWTFTSKYNCAPAKVQVNVEDCSGIEIAENTSLSIMPNPTTESFLLQVNRQTNIQVYTLLGSKIHENTVNGSYTFGNDFAKGVYVVRLSNGVENRVMKVVKD